MCKTIHPEVCTEQCFNDALYSRKGKKSSYIDADNRFVNFKLKFLFIYAKQSFMKYKSSQLSPVSGQDMNIIKKKIFAIFIFFHHQLKKPFSYKAMCLICSSSGTKEHNFLMLVHEFREKKMEFVIIADKNFE